MKTGKLSELIENMCYPEEEPRDYIGASNIGSECYRQIWYEFTGESGEPVSPKIKRTWEIGKALEVLILNWIESSGIEISRIWFDLKDKELSYFRGHVDAMCTKEGEAQYIIEIKTAKDASFNLFVKNGCKSWNSRYYAQLQAYMGMSGIHNAYILVLNKDNSSIMDECIEFDESYYESLKLKARMIYEATMPPPKISGSPLWFACKMCKFRKICHE